MLSTVAAKTVLEDIASTFERDSKQKLILRFGTAAELKSEIEKGAPCDVALLTAAAVDDLIKQGRLTPSSRSAIAKSGVGIAIRKGASSPAIATPDDLKQALVAAKSIALSAQGASEPIMKRIFERFGLTEVMNGKTVIVTTTTAPEAVAAGQAELAFTQISEILATEGAVLVGPLPPDLQVYTSFVAGVAASARDSAAAQAFVDLLTAPKTSAVFKAKGLEPSSGLAQR